MHEFSIAQSLVDSVLHELAARNIGPGRLRSVRLAAGRMHGLIEDSLQFVWGVLIEDTPAAGAALSVREIPIRVRCKTCNALGGIPWPQFACEACGGGDLDIVEGRELHLESMEIEDEPGIAAPAPEPGGEGPAAPGI